MINYQKAKRVSMHFCLTSWYNPNQSALIEQNTKGCRLFDWNRYYYNLHTVKGKKNNCYILDFLKFLFSLKYIPFNAKLGSCKR